jgi:hypothetical protein
MSKLRRSARGKMCALQIYPHCNNNKDTVVLCHLSSSFSGISMKSKDFFAVYGCSSCHDVIDGRVKTQLSKEEILRCQLRALERTWNQMIEDGLISYQ